MNLFNLRKWVANALSTWHIYLTCNHIFFTMPPLAPPRRTWGDARYTISIFQSLSHHQHTSTARLLAFWSGWGDLQSRFYSYWFSPVLLQYLPCRSWKQHLEVAAFGVRTTQCLKKERTWLTSSAGMEKFYRKHFPKLKTVQVGYMGGKLDDPSHVILHCVWRAALKLMYRPIPLTLNRYEDVCSGLTGHAEVVHLEYDPAEVSYRELGMRNSWVH